MNPERRADQRVHQELPVYIFRGGIPERVEMNDVSYRGVLLRMASPPGIRELVKLRIDLPTGELVAHAVVAHVVGADERGLFSLGMRFFALRNPEKSDWEQFVATVIHGRQRAA